MHITPLLPEDEFNELPIIELQGLSGNPPAAYAALQKFMLPYIDMIHLFWWGCLVLTMAVVITRYMLLPLVRGRAAAETTPRSPAAGMRGLYRRLFSIDEIEQDILVRWFGGAILLGYLATFRAWQQSIATTVQAVEAKTYTCWPFFPNCGDWIFLDAFPHGYSQMTLFMVLFTFILTAAYGLITRRGILAHASIAVLLIAKGYFTLINFFYNGNYDYYLTTFSLIFVFVPHKRFFASLAVAMLYVLSTVAKIHPGWTMGLYFTSLKPGMPIFPNAIVPLMTNLVICMEMIMAWFLFSRRVWLQRAVFAFFCLFHIYSGTIVGFHYPTIVMPALLVCFGPLFRPFAQVPLGRSAIMGWVLAVILWVLQLIPVMIPGDTKLTLEGNFYGLYMFEANHQCHVLYTGEKGDVMRQVNGVSARFRCDPWPFLFTAQNIYCKGEGPKRAIRMYMLHSINGGPFYEIVNEPNVCNLTYKPFGRNPWIKDATNARIVGRPLKNLYD